MEPGQFDEWLAFYNIEPWGDDWWQAAGIQAATLNANRGSGEQISASELIPTRENLAKSGNEITEDQLSSSWKQRLGF